MEHHGRLGRYELLELLGKGGMGEVFLANDPSLQRQVAIKVVGERFAADELARKRLLREARTAGDLNHPNICTIHDVGDEDGTIFVAMEYIRGHRLIDMARRGGGDFARLSAMAKQLAAGMQHAHERGVVHRDLKTANVLVTASGQIKILDFGLARTLDAQRVEDALTTRITSAQEGGLTGTLPYMAPELLRGGEASPRSDVWALGMILYELCVGRLPFSGGTPFEISSEILSPDPVDLPVQLGPFRDAIARCLDKAPEGRFKDAGQLAVALEGIEGPPRRSSTRRQAATLAAAAAGLALGIWALRPDRAGDLDSTATPQPLASLDALVVLPCQVFGNDDDAYLADAVPEWITSGLGDLEPVQLRLSPSVLRVDPRTVSLREIAGSYEVQRVVTCSVTEVDDALRLGVALVDPETERIEWSRAYVGNDSHALAREASDGLRGRVGPPAARPAAVTARSPDALAAHGRGRYYMRRYNQSHRDADFDEASRHLHAALEADDEMAVAMGDLAMLNVFRIEAGGAEAAAEAVEWARRAIAADPDTARAWIALAAAGEDHTGHGREGLSNALRAASLDPSDPVVQLGVAETTAGVSFELGNAVFGRLTDLDPYFALPWVNLGLNTYYLARFEESLAALDRALVIEPGMWAAQWARVFVLGELGRAADAVAQLSWVESNVASGRLPPLWGAMARFAALRADGRHEETGADRAALVSAFRDPSTTAHDRHWILAFFAPYVAAEGDLELALEVLGAGAPPELLRANPHFGALRADARFEELLRDAEAAARSDLAFVLEARRAGLTPRYLDEALDALADTYGLPRS